MNYILETILYYVMTTLPYRILAYVPFYNRLRLPVKTSLFIFAAINALQIIALYFIISNGISFRAVEFIYAPYVFSYIYSLLM